MIIVPKESPIITDSNIPINESGITVWDVDTTYNDGDIIQYEDSIYRSITTTTGDQPDTAPLIWIYERKANYYAMFDALMNTKTTNYDTISYTFKSSDVDYIAFFNIIASSVRVIVTNTETDTVIQDTTKDTLERDVSDWFDWTYNKDEYIESVFFNLNLAYSVSIQIIIDNSGGIAECGQCVYGRGQNVGLTLADEPTSSIRNIYSKEKDDNGNITVSQSKTFNSVELSVLIKNSSVDRVQRRLKAINGTPTLFIGDDREGGYESLMTYGLHKDFSLPISVTQSQYKIEIEGLI